MNSAMRFFIKEVLEIVEEKGLPGNHYFFITFSTLHPHVILSKDLKDRFPNEMTIVLQNWFDELKVKENEFSVTLNFSEKLENLVIPYDSLVSFLDPSVEFGVKFQQNTNKKNENENSEQGRERDAQIVSLDSFRKS
tara:strand:+ start:115 stop:525 length:411 start_codon:yes stop_codon:yes gene_type:complete